YILFGFTLRSNLTKEERAIRTAISNCKAYISLKLTGEEIIESSKLQAILISVAARYTAFALKIPTLGGGSWDNASVLVKYFLSTSQHYAKAIRIIVKNIRNLKKNLSFTI
ncbi:Uncharacterized protein FKW44_021678, partial [Caligus rogercresseyi]